MVYSGHRTGALSAPGGSPRGLGGSLYEPLSRTNLGNLYYQYLLTKGF